jgi:ABC-2 type transport system ATP-binding protein
MTADPVIATENLGRRFGDQLVLDAVTLEVPAGGVHAVVGRNGAGKSTLYRLLLGFLTPTAGRSRVLGTDSTALLPATRGRIGFVPESHALPGWMTAATLAALTRTLHPGWSEPTFREVASQFRLRADRPVRELSRGERAGLALALALAPGPELLLLDEPTLGLDVVASRAFLDSLLFAGERERGTVVYSSHQMDEVERVADRVTILRHGRVVASAPPDELLTRISAWAVEAWPMDADVRRLPGLLQARTLDGVLEVVVLDQGDGMAQHLASSGGRGVSRLPLGFDRAMAAFLGQPAAAGGNEDWGVR